MFYYSWAFFIVISVVAVVKPFYFKICVCRGSGLAPPKIYRGPSRNSEENEEDEIDSDISTTFTNANDVNPNCVAVATNSLSASDVADKTSSHLQLDGDYEVTLAAKQLSSSPQDGFDAGEFIVRKDKVTAKTHDNECSEESMDSLLQKHSDNVDRLLKSEACDIDGKNDSISSVDQPSGDANVDNTVLEKCEEPDGNSNKLPPSREKSVSPPISIPGSNIDAVVNGDDSLSPPQCLGSVSEDIKTPTPLTSEEVGSGSSKKTFPSFYDVRKKSVPRFTSRGSFIIPADEDIYVDLSCGLFSTDPGHVGRVQDVSTLPSPPERPFTIGDSGQNDLVYYEEKESIVSALTISGQSFRFQKTSADSECEHSDGEVSEQDLTSSADIKVEMIDATSREVLAEIFKRTSGKVY